MTTETLAIYQDAIAAFDESITTLTCALEPARAARPVDMDALFAMLRSTAGTAGAVRQALSALAEAAGEPIAEWTTREELDATVRQLVVRAEERAASQWRDRLKEVAVTIAAGRVVNPRTGRVIATLDHLRISAADEVARLADGTQPLKLAEPVHGPWLYWVWKQASDALETDLDALRGRAPLLCQFLLDVDPGQWRLEPAAEPVQPDSALLPAIAVSARNAPLTDMASPSPHQAELDLMPVDQHQPVDHSQAQGRVSEPPAADLPASPPVPIAGPSLSVSKPLVPAAVDYRPIVTSTASAAPLPPISPPEQVLDGSPPRLSAADLGSADEIRTRCILGNYLEAAILAAGRAFGGLPEVDPRFDTLLLAHHVCKDSRTIPWPEWCYDADAAARCCQTTPDSARLVFLAAQCQTFRSEGRIGPLPETVTGTLLGAFNDLPEVRKWLTTFLEAANVPGLWEQVCGPATADPAAEFRERRKAFVDRYDAGMLHRSDKVAYVHRQDHFLSRHPAAKLLCEYLKTSRLGPATPEMRRQVTSFVEQRTDAVTSAWLSSTERATGGKIKLRGSQRTDLVRNAAEYLDCASRAWRAAEALLRAPPQTGEIERRKKQLREDLGTALARAEGRPWCPLFRRLVGGLAP